MRSTKKQQTRLHTAALAFAVGGIWLTVVALVPSAAEQRVEAETIIAKPSVEALAARESSQGAKTAVLPSIPPKTKIQGNGKASGKVRTIKTTCYTDLEVRGNATKQDIKVGEVATNLAPQGAMVRIGGKLHRVHSWPDDKTDADIFYGFTKADQERCLDRGVRYLSFEVVSHD